MNWLKLISSVFLLLNILLTSIKASPIDSIKIKSKKFENLANCGLYKSKSISQYVVGGMEASRGQFPWQVSLQTHKNNMWFHICAAVILNTNWILTAAHCINGQDWLALRAVVGAHQLDQPVDSQTNYEILEIIKHESYSAQTLANDIALIRVKSPINLDGSDGYVNSVCLPTESQKFAQYVTLSGWGATVSGGQTVSNKLMYVNDVPIVSLPKCGPIYGFNAIKEGMLCAGAGAQQVAKGFCQGDSGGPLVQVQNGRAVLAGIASFNRDCATSVGLPDVFVEVSYFRNWIDTNVV